MIKSYNRKLIGLDVKTNEGYIAKVIDGGSTKRTCTIQIEEYIKEVDTSGFKKGSIKYPLHKSVLNYGYLGIGKYYYKQDYSAYKAWSRLIKREGGNAKTFTGHLLPNDWGSFQVFTKWYYSKNLDTPWK